MAIVTVDLPLGQAVRIQRSNKVNRFMAVGRMINNKGFDFAAVMCTLSPMAHKLFWEMVQIRDVDTNIITIDSSKNTNSQNATISKGYRILQEADLLLKVGKGLYLINPHAVLPTMDRCELVNIEWDKYKDATRNKKG